MPTTPTLADDAARGWLTANVRLLSAKPGFQVREGTHGATEIVTGIPLASQNGIADVSRDPSPAEIAELAASPRLRELPWTLFIRAEPVDERIVRVATDHGLTERAKLPFMIRELSAADTAAVPGARRVGPADTAVYARLMAAGFESPEELFAPFADPAVTQLPEVIPYLIEADGVPVATSVGLVSDGLVGVFNIAVPPEFRRRGYGRLATAAVLREAYAAGAHAAYLSATPDGFPLYESMGFEHVESWNLFFPPS